MASAEGEECRRCAGTSREPAFGERAGDDSGAEQNRGARQIAEPRAAQARAALGLHIAAEDQRGADLANARAAEAA